MKKNKLTIYIHEIRKAHVVVKNSEEPDIQYNGFRSIKTYKDYLIKLEVEANIYIAENLHNNLFIERISKIYNELSKDFTKSTKKINEDIIIHPILIVNTKNKTPIPISSLSEIVLIHISVFSIEQIKSVLRFQKTNNNIAYDTKKDMKFISSFYDSEIIELAQSLIETGKINFPYKYHRLEYLSNRLATALFHRNIKDVQSKYNEILRNKNKSIFLDKIRDAFRLIPRKKRVKK